MALACLQFSHSVVDKLTLGDPVDSSMPGFPVHHQLVELVQTLGHPVSNAFQPSHPLLSPSPAAFSLFQRISSSHQAARVLELQLQHQSLQ